MPYPIKFSEGNHQYRMDGKHVRGVTTLISNGLPKEFIPKWAAKTVAEYVIDNPEHVDQLRNMGREMAVDALKGIPWTKRDKAGERGKRVHAIAERLVVGEEVEVPEDIAGHVDSCLRFFDEWRVTPLIVERYVGHRAHWWAGTPDLFATLPDGRTALFDHKTADSGIWPETAFQLAAYSHAEFWQDAEGNEQPIPPVDFCAAVHLRADGYSVIPVKADDDVYAEFRHIAFVANTAKRMRDYVLPELDCPTWAEVAA